MKIKFILLPILWLCLFLIFDNTIKSENNNTLITTIETSTETTTEDLTTTTQKPKEEFTYILNTNSKKLHYIDCPSVKTMKNKNKEFSNNYSMAISNGYIPCKRCNPVNEN